MKWKGREESKNVENRGVTPRLSRGRGAEEYRLSKRKAETDEGVSELANKMVERERKQTDAERGDYKARDADARNADNLIRDIQAESRYQDRKDWERERRR